MPSLAATDPLNRQINSSLGSGHIRVNLFVCLLVFYCHFAYALNIHFLDSQTVSITKYGGWQLGWPGCLNCLIAVLRRRHG